MLNNKGMTTVEILMVFVIIGIISVGLFSMISSFNNKQNVESAKEKLMTFKNTVTRDIEGDIVRRGLVSVKVTENHQGTATTGNKDTYTAALTFKDGTTKNLVIYKEFFEGHDATKSADVYEEGVEGSSTEGCLEVSTTAKEKFTITYGNGSDVELYELPDLGSSINDCDHLTKDLRFNDVEISTKDNILNIFIGFYHPDLSTRYAINIICPINFDDINTTYSDNPFADSIIKLRSDISASGDVQYQVNNGGVLQGRTANNAVIGTITLKEEVTEGTEGIQERSGIVCKYYKNDTTQDYTGGVLITNRKTTTFKGSNIVTELTLQSKIAEGGNSAVHAVCTATIKDGFGIEKKEVWDGWIGNGIQTDPTTYDTNAIVHGKYHYYYAYIGGSQVLGREAKIYWYNEKEPQGHVATYYCLSGNENWYFENKQKTKGMTAQGWVRKDDNKWYYYMDHRYRPEQNGGVVKFVGEKLSSGSFVMSYPAFDSPTQTFSFDANGKCTAGQGC